jgi:hypothetical protein
MFTDQTLKPVLLFSKFSIHPPCKEPTSSEPYNRGTQKQHTWSQLHHHRKITVDYIAARGWRGAVLLIDTGTGINLIKKKAHQTTTFVTQRVSQLAVANTPVIKFAI